MGAGRAMLLFLPVSPYFKKYAKYRIDTIHSFWHKNVPVNLCATKTKIHKYKNIGLLVNLCA